ncbi:MAG: hypothetical protein QME41_04750 [Actinomycetota bacterium]|nr:hypothetical protein [Actinomycetota bacterium]
MAGQVVLVAVGHVHLVVLVVGHVELVVVELVELVDVGQLARVVEHVALGL